jgi:hypothetical protein
VREHGGKDGTTGCGVLSRIVFPAAEATFGARWAARAGPVRGAARGYLKTTHYSHTTLPTLKITHFLGAGLVN